MNTLNTQGIAKIIWDDPRSGTRQQYLMGEGATASIGRSPENDICIPEQHVSRRHAVINYRDGLFMITDLGSVNGTYVNDQKLEEPFPLASDDVIRLYVPVLVFSAAVSVEDQQRAAEDGKLITATISSGKGKIIITNGPQEGQTIPLLIKKVTVGRATSNATWEVALQDPSVSRPHARFETVDGGWVLYDLGSSNGTMVNGMIVTEKGRVLHDGDTISFGATIVLFRSN
jgi:pSer/pThr/pTyr-binding forkhead associated (FHA) protein